MVSVLILDVGQNRDLKPTHRNHIQIVSKSYQNCIKIISKPQKQSRHRPKGCPGTVSVSFLEANPSGTLKKALRSQTLSKPCKNHIQNILKPYLNNMPYPNRFISSNRIKNHIKIGKKKTELDILES